MVGSRDLFETVLQLKLDVGGHDDGVEVGRDADEEDGRQLFALHRPELDAAEDEKRQDGRKVDDHPGDEHPSVVLRGAVDQPEVGEDLWTNRGKVLLYRNKLEQAS